MYIDAYRLVMIGAALIVLLIFFGGPDASKNLRVKTKEEKWREAIERQTDPQNQNPLSVYGITGGIAGGPSPQASQGQAVLPSPFSGTSPFPVPGAPLPALPNLQYPQGVAGTTQEGTLPYQANRYAPQSIPGYIPPDPVPGGGFGAGQPQNDAPSFPQAAPRWNRPQDMSPQAGGEGRGYADPRFFLRSGQEVFFSGPYVYVYDEQGQPIPLPDGNYIDSTSTRTLSVQEGKRIIAN